ncbi:MAG: hypothetical protein GXO79_00690 [Chlorobi bacterium]|nr:hypothetical protein [Chlorobiota bacterium]
MKQPIFPLKLLILISLIFLLYNPIFSQEELKKEVRVVKPYEASISDAYKLNIMPKIVDTLEVLPEFEYKLKSYPLKINYNVEPIHAAKLIGEPLKKLYNSYFKLGFGNYLTSLVDIYYDSKYAKKYSYQTNFKHFSSSGRIKNEKGRKIFSGFRENTLDLSGKRFLKDKTLSGIIDYKNNSYFLYGYNPEKTYFVYPPSIKKNMDKQQINDIVGKIRLESNYLDSLNANYDLSLAYGYMQDINKISEQNIDLNVKINYFFDNEFTGIDSRIETYNKSIANSSVVNNPKIDNQLPFVNTLVKFNPWIGAFGPKWQIKAGVNTYYELEDTKYHFYPHLSIHYNVIDYFFIPYFEYQGKIEINSFKKMLFENPYFLFPVNVKSTEYNKIISGGVRGNFSSNMSFNFRVNYSDIKNMYFYVNDTVHYSENLFTVEYDDLNLVNFVGEISYKQGERLNFLIKGNYNYYDLDSLPYAWHKPNYKISFNTRYNIKNKILVDFNVFAISKRYVKIYKPIEKAGTLNGIVDVNLGLEYRYSKKLSAFLKLNNIGAIKYQQWNYYPTERFNFMAGITYSL